MTKLRFFAIAFAGLLSVGAGCAGAPEGAEGAATEEGPEGEDGAASLVAASADLPPQVVTPPAGTGTLILGSIGNQGDIIKIKTVWGGGYVLNTTVGELKNTASGIVARVHWNSANDDINRFKVEYNFNESGFTWARLRNRYSGKCLAAAPISSAYVTQETCNDDDPAQWWAVTVPAPPILVKTNLLNLAHFRANMNDMATQMGGGDQVVGALIQMKPDIHSLNRQDWRIYNCVVNGVEQPNC